MTLKYAEDMDEKEFQRKKQMSELLLKEQELQGRQDSQMVKDKAGAEAELVKKLQAQGQSQAQPPQGPMGM